jgi:hypothetical protein
MKDNLKRLNNHYLLKNQKPKHYRKLFNNLKVCYKTKEMNKNQINRKISKLLWIEYKFS